jgi:hypothetical protein
MDLTPPRSTRPVFRAEAVKEYVRSREEVILPRFVSPRTIVLLWSVLGAILLGTAALLTIRLPLYTSATVLAPRGDGGALAVSVPLDVLEQVRPGQRAYFRGEDGERRPAGRVRAVEGEAVRTAPGRPGTERPGATVLVRLDPDMDAACRAPACRVEIRIGTPRAASFFAPGELRTGDEPPD